MNVALEIAKVVATAVAEAWQKCVCRAIASKQSKTAWRQFAASGGEIRRR